MLASLSTSIHLDTGVNPAQISSQASYVIPFFLTAVFIIMPSLEDIADFTNSRLSPSRLSPYIVAGVATLSLFAIFRSSQGSPWVTKKDNIVPSPLDTTIPGLSKEEIDELPYPPDLFPGARDVDTPYGSIRVYEWGPKDGRKVLFVHGISTPCLSLGRIAQQLADKGCRVMLMGMSTSL